MKPATALRLCAFAFAAAAACATAQAADPPKFAWGKAGVSFDQYQSEAYDCAMTGLGTDLSQTEPVEKLREATRRMEALDARQGVASSADPVEVGIRNAQDRAAVEAAARPEQQIREVKRIIFAAMQQCMVLRGYTRFALTEEQRHAIDKLKDGSDERRAYIHKLASDAAVLERQKQPLPER